MSNRISVVVIGEGGSGKSTLIGRLLADVGGMDPRFVEKGRADSDDAGRPDLRYAFLAMRRQTERRIRCTQESCVFELENLPAPMNIIDTPGDPKYLKNFCTGLAKVDAALVVMDMELGVEESNQYGERNFRGRGGLREKCMVAYAMGARSTIVVYNKMDASKINYDKDKYEEVRAKMADILTKSGLAMNKNVPVHLPLSAWEGANFEGPCEPLSWFEGPTLLEALSAIPPPKRESSLEKPFRMSLDNCMRISGVGTVLTGKVLSGSVVRGDRLTVVSDAQAEREFMVSSIESHHQPLERASAGDVVGVAAMGGLKKNYKRGDVLVKRDDPKRPAQMLKATMVVLHAPNMIRPGYMPMLHIGHAAVPCKVGEILNRKDLKGGAILAESPRGLKAGECGDIVVHPSKPICIECSANLNILSRAVLVDGNRVVGLCSVKEVDGPEGKRVILTKSAAKRA